MRMPVAAPALLQGLVGAARRSWAQAHQRQLVGYIRAYRAGLAWLYDRANRAEALAVLLSSYERTRR